MVDNTDKEQSTVIKKAIMSLYGFFQEDGYLLPKISLITFITGLSFFAIGGVGSLLFMTLNRAPFLNIQLLEQIKITIQIILESGNIFFFSVFLTLFIIGSYRNMRITKNKKLQSLSSDEHLITVAMKQEITFEVKMRYLTFSLFSFIVGMLPLIKSDQKLSNDIASTYIVAPSLLMVLSAHTVTLTFFAVFLFYLVPYINKTFSNLVKSNIVRVAFHTANTDLKNKFDNLPEAERLESLEKAKLLGISPSNKNFIKTVLTDYEKRRQTALNEEKQLNNQTANALNSNRKQTRL